MEAKLINHVAGYSHSKSENRNPNSTSNSVNISRQILEILMPYRRLISTAECCDVSFCNQCASHHAGKIQRFIEDQAPITFALPAFPSKSPNLSKVFSARPDQAEKMALRFLNRLCQEIGEVYSFGANIILCSDGRVFSDLIGMQESDVTDYQEIIAEMIREDGLDHLTLFSLDEVSHGKSFDEVRAWLLEHFGSSLADFKASVVRGGAGSNESSDLEAHRMYCGITRFLVDDMDRTNINMTKNQIQKDCKTRAAKVIQRSNAWSEFIGEKFPNAVRLSIHPQSCGAKKLGIHLIGTEAWMTPWHGVLVETDGGFRLMKRWQAEELSAKLILDHQSRPSHFKL
ncbi:MAG: isocyanide synthase family protein [Proteobacteria bacterium]|nr:isocyanide synthase family protein [Pseudomonadota bacterium]